MNKLRQEFCDEINTPMGLDNEFDYIRWLEAKIQALRKHDVVGQSEQLSCETCKFNCDDWDYDHPCSNCTGFEFWEAT